MAIPNCDELELISPEQFETLTGVKTQTQAVWRCTGREPLPWVKLGRLVRYCRQDVRAFIENNTTGQKGAA